MSKFYLEGNFAPVQDETTAFDLRVEGAIPPALEGRYRPPRMPAFRYPETVVVPPLEPAAPAAVPEGARP